MNKRQRVLPVLLAGALAFAAASCGDDDDDATTEATDAAATAAPAADTTEAAPTTAADTATTAAAPEATDAPTTVAAEPVSIKVGFAAPLSGAYVTLGEAAQRGAELAVEQLAEEGVTIDLVVEDTASDPQTTLNAFTKLISEDDVDAILGTLCSACNLAATQVLDQAQIPQLTIGEGSASACEASDLVVCVVEDSASRVDVIEQAAQDAGATSVGIIQVELSAPGKEVTDALSAALPESGIDVNVAIAAADAQDFKAQLTSLSDSDMIVVAGAAGAQSGIVLRNMEDLGMQQPVLGLIWSGEILTAASEQFVEDQYQFTAAYVASDPASADFTAAFAEAYDGAAPDKYAATAYTSTMLLAEAARAAGVDDGPALRAAVEDVQIETPLGDSAVVDGVWAIPARLAAFVDGQQVFAS